MKTLGHDMNDTQVGIIGFWSWLGFQGFGYLTKMLGLITLQEFSYLGAGIAALCTGAYYLVKGVKEVKSMFKDKNDE